MPTINTVNNQFFNNLSVTTAVAGATAAVTLSNADNTDAASHAKTLSLTGGASAGDAYVHFTNGVVNWTMGVDNSDADALVISYSDTPGTTNVARCSVDGEWTYPLQPGFNAFKDASASNVTGTATLYKPVHNQERFDRNADYSTATGNFTAPVTGKYLLTGSANIGGGTAMTTTDLLIVTTAKTYYSGRRAGASLVSQMVNHAVIADMTAADTAYLQVRSYTEASNTDDYYGAAGTSYNHFTGTLLQ